MNNGTIDPPLKHRDHQWHWARHEQNNLWFVFEARNGFMWNGPRHMSAATAYSEGWRYVGPALPPAERSAK